GARCRLRRTRVGRDEIFAPANVPQSRTRPLLIRCRTTATVSTSLTVWLCTRCTSASRGQEVGNVLLSVSTHSGREARSLPVLAGWGCRVRTRSSALETAGAGWGGGRLFIAGVRIGLSSARWEFPSVLMKKIAHNDENKMRT